MKKSKKLAIAVLLCLVSMLPAFAYEMPKILYLDKSLDNTDILKSDGDFVRFIPY